MKGQGTKSSLLTPCQSSGISKTTTPISDTICQFGGSPRPPSGSGIYRKDPQNSARALALMAMVYYRKEKTKIS